jgi:hypothetical protein
MNASFAEKNAIRADAIATRQLHALVVSNWGFVPFLRAWPIVRFEIRISPVKNGIP